jgi:hypothetical protein
MRRNAHRDGGPGSAGARPTAPTLGSLVQICPTGRTDCLPPNQLTSPLLRDLTGFGHQSPEGDSGFRTGNHDALIFIFNALPSQQLNPDISLTPNEDRCFTRSRFGNPRSDKLGTTSTIAFSDEHLRSLYYGKEKPS